ncbi:Galectin-3-binding protein A [Holothuria leucospilota]|uniref:Galectin-3-binding protein A n=1 Tax=Holothuria leucospilota TaxID=206669 RepID=A0A9Q1BUI1_HOLLE|nr:Galectin-3-binding protein A [Holothuria leucospilota]
MDLSTSQLFHSVCLLLLLSCVEGTNEKSCTFGDEANNDGEGYFRLFPGKPQGRVEVRCGLNDEWGTISCKGTTNTEIVATLVCRKLGYGDGIPLQQSDELVGGYGPVWNVECREQHRYIENCTFKRADEEAYDYAPTYPYWDHINDLYVKCGARPTLDDRVGPPDNTVMFILVDVATFVVLLVLIIVSGFVVYQLLIRKFKSVRNSKSASLATTPV